MFTETIDYAIDRWTTEDGREFAVIYDEDAENPVEDGWCGYGMCFVPCDDRRITSGDESLVEALEAWEDERESLEWQLEYAATHNRSTLLEELIEHDENKPEIEMFETTHFRVFFDREAIKKHYDTPDDLVIDLVKADLDVYKAWCDGAVYTVGVTYPDGSEDMLSGIYIDSDGDLRAEIENVF